MSRTLRAPPASDAPGSGFPLASANSLLRTEYRRVHDALVALADANAELAQEIEKLRTPEGVEMAIRTELGFVKPGEQPLEILDDPSAPKKLPTAWPYTMVSNILIVRAEAAKSAAENDDGVLSPLTP